uniref:Zgc:154075 n=1 Tax=Neogobius melanostomus TaxID=47308 RepID=A0A8C6U865_9GOBI
MTPVSVIVVGAGSRGDGYSNFASIHPDRMKVVGVADPRKFARTKLEKKHNIIKENVSEDWESMAEREKFADAVLICTPDRLHKDPAVAFAKKGYHILLEKPMATSAEDCTAIVEACTQKGVMLSVGHVLPVFHLCSIFFDFCMSHIDRDKILTHVCSARCVKVSSFGSVSHFKKADKPTGAGDRCLDCAIEPHCPYSASKIYLSRVKQGHTGWPVSVICPDSYPDIESVTEALKNGPYGRCVYECDNDVCTNQVVNMEFEGGVTAAFSMVAFTEKLCQRQTTIYGSKGELSYDGNGVRVFDFLTQRSTKYHPQNDAPHFGMNGHGGADYHLMDAFISAVANNDPSFIRSGPEETLHSHLLVFEAERSHVESRVIYCGDDSRK